MPASGAMAADVTGSTKLPRLAALGPWSARTGLRPSAHTAFTEALSAMGTAPPLLSLRRKRRVVVLPDVEMEEERSVWLGSNATWRMRGSEGRRDAQQTSLVAHKQACRARNKPERAHLALRVA